jgi:integral membrane sensor domain MASE1
MIGLGLFALGAGGAWALQFWPCVILGAVVGALAWGLLLSYVEMVEIIFDTLVPR